MKIEIQVIKVYRCDECHSAGSITTSDDKNWEFTCKKCGVAQDVSDYLFQYEAARKRDAAKMRK